MLPTVHRSRSARHASPHSLIDIKSANGVTTGVTRYLGRIPRVCTPLDTTTRTLMRSFKILSGLSAGVLLALAGGAQARDRHDTFSVTATVVANCSVDARPTWTSATSTDRSISPPRRRSTSPARTAHRYSRRLNVGTRPAARSPHARCSTNGAGHAGLQPVPRCRAHTRSGATRAASTTSTAPGTGSALARRLTRCMAELPSAGNEDASTGLYSLDDHGHRHVLTECACAA